MPNGVSLERYRREFPDPKTITGVVYSNPYFETWKDTEGHEHPACYFKVFIWAKLQKVRACILFEQATEAMRLQKYDKVRISGYALLVETRAGKKFYNFNVNQLEILPPDRAVIDWRFILERIDAIFSGYDGIIARLNRIERRLGISENISDPVGDKRRHRVMDSLSPIVGDIYTGADADEDEEDED